MGNWKNKFIAKRPASCSPLKAMYNEGGPGDPPKRTSTKNPDGSITVTSTKTNPGTPGKPPPGLPTVETQWNKNANDVQSKFDTIDDFRIYVKEYNEKKYGTEPETETESFTYTKAPSIGIKLPTSTPTELQRLPVDSDGDGGGNGDGDGTKDKPKKKKKKLFKNRNKKKRVKKPKKTKPQYRTKSSTACTFGSGC
tara:strand:- start:174 stop:761 length:588 start_codon:yes stop_codon:yes gene_type:complete